jgi:diketogulonate reductase-like aldo/keto reductase
MTVGELTGDGHARVRADGPVSYRRALLDACRQRGVLVEAYSSLGTGRLLDNRTVRRVAKRVGRTPAQVLLR